MAQPPELTAEQLRSRLYQTLRDRGLVGTLQSQLRNILVQELQHYETGEPILRQPARKKENFALFFRAANSLIVDHLKRSKYDYTLSVFIPETGENEGKIMSFKELLALLNISPESALYNKLISKNSQGKSRGFLWHFLHELAQLHGYSCKESSVQTDPAPFLSSQASLEEQFNRLDRYYSSKSDELYSKHSVEERMLTFQRQLEERSRTEFQLECARFKDNELSRMRMEEREKSRQEIEKIRKEMEQSYRAKYEMLAERDRFSTEKFQKAKEIQDREVYNQRQSLLEEIEALRQREAALRRQDEISKREQQLWEEKVKTREESAKYREETARKLELELHSKIHDQVTKFKLEEQSRSLEKTKNIELREAGLKDNERKVYDELREIREVKDELKEKRHRVNELEAELIKARHDMISSEKKAEILNEKAKEMADYQIVRENNALLRKEVDDLKVRIQELTRDVLVERQRNEDLLRELGHVNNTPTSEMFQLRKQVEKLQSEVRQEKAFSEHKRAHYERRYQEEADRNQQLMRKYEDQTLQTRDVIKELNDYRKQLQHTKVALTNEVYRKPRGDLFNDSDSLCGIEGHVGVRNVQADMSRTMHGPVNVERDWLVTDMEHGPGGDSSRSFSYKSDIVKETKRRLQGLESEAANLEENYRNYQLRLTSGAVSTGKDDTFTPAPAPVTPSKTTVTFSTADRLDGQGYSPTVAGSKGRSSLRDSSKFLVSSTPAKPSPGWGLEPTSPPPAKSAQGWGHEPTSPPPDINTTISTIPSIASPPHQTTMYPAATTYTYKEPVTLQASKPPSTQPVGRPERVSPTGQVTEEKHDDGPAAISLDDAWRTAGREEGTKDVVSLDDAWRTKRDSIDEGPQSAQGEDITLQQDEPKEDNIDPVMKKYMAMVQQQKAREQGLAQQTIDTWRRDSAIKTPVASVSEDLSADNEDSQHSKSGEDDW